MVAQYINLTEHDATTGINTFKNYGPSTVTAGFTITRIQVSGECAFPPQTTTAGIALENFLQHGIQHGTIGYTPTNAESVTSPGSEWLRFVGQRSTSSELATTHNTPGSDVSARYVVDLVWEGQFYTPNGTDVYYSVGRTFNAGINWYFQGSIVIAYG